VSDQISTSSILGINVARLTVDQFIDCVVASARERRRWRVCYVNAANFNLVATERRFADVLRSADLVYADGQAVVWASRYLGCPLPERVNAGDFFERFCRVCARENLSFYLIGSSPGIAQRAAQNLTENIAGLRIVGAREGYFEPTMSGTIIGEINQLAPHFLIVGMGAPRQELWVADNIHRLDVGVAWSVGALFEYLSGTRPRAPVWMRRAGLEWLFRLVLEPRRLCKRYLLGNWVFAWRVLRERWSRSGSSRCDQ